VAPLLKEWVLASPELSCKQLLCRLQQQEPHTYPDAWLKKLQRMVSPWRAVAGIRRPYGRRNTAKGPTNDPKG
jgi:hypothetical protein